MRTSFKDIYSKPGVREWVTTLNVGSISSKTTNQNHLSSIYNALNINNKSDIEHLSIVYRESSSTKKGAQPSYVNMVAQLCTTDECFEVLKSKGWLINENNIESPKKSRYGAIDRAGFMVYKDAEVTLLMVRAIRMLLDLNKETELNDYFFEYELKNNPITNGLDQLSVETIVDNLVIIKINKLYRDNMSAEELYETTRGIWKRKIDSVAIADYCLSVANSVVHEVYKIDQWYEAGTTPMKTRSFSTDDCKGRIEFVGEIAPNNIRNRYIGKSVANLYKNGEADPVKVFLKQNSVANINISIEPLEIVDKDGKIAITCPNCTGIFEKAPRCPECGQLIKYE